MKLTLTTMQGNTKDISLMTKQEVNDFIELFQSTLHPNQRIKVTCDLLGIDGYLQGTVQVGGGTPYLISVLTIIFAFIFYKRVSYI